MQAPLTLDDLPEDELHEEFICGTVGPGGQHVNRTATTVRLTLETTGCRLLTPEETERLLKMAGHQAVGTLLVIQARESRSLATNRRRAREKLLALLNAARKPPVPRRPTRPTKAAKARRLADKMRRSQLKTSRKRPDEG